MRSSVFVIAFLTSAAVASTSIATAPHGGALTARLPTTEDSSQASVSEERVAARLQARVRKRFGFTPGAQQLLHGMRAQRDLLSRRVTLTFVADDGAAIAPWIAGAERFVHVDVALGGITSAIDARRISAEFRAQLPEGVRVPAASTLLSRSAVDGIARVESDGIAKSGYDFDAEAIADRVAHALVNAEGSVRISLKTVPGTIVNATGQDLGDLELLASGRSNFEGSGNGRKSNVRKGLTKYIHNLVVEPDEEFSINRVLKWVPISEWEMALGIFNGGDLRPVAGGGLCQVATTLYRGILNAGFPVTQRRNHSLFVHYYEKHGVGIDATIFPASAPDLRFVNDTDKPLLIQAYVEGDEATVSIYGTDDGRTVQLTGPYFAENAPEDFRVSGSKLSSREIAWLRDVTYADGRTDQYVVHSRYKSIPRSVVREYLGTLASSHVNTHAAAPEEAPPEGNFEAHIPLQ